MLKNTAIGVTTVGLVLSFQSLGLHQYSPFMKKLCFKSFPRLTSKYLCSQPLLLNPLTDIGNMISSRKDKINSFIVNVSPVYFAKMMFVQKFQKGKIFYTRENRTNT